MPHSVPPRIAVIGAGMAGLSCASALRKAGCLPVVFEKSRGIGGRLATRRTADGDCFDHGAQYITAREPIFQRMLLSLEQRQAAAAWTPRDPSRTASPSHRWTVGTPGMSALLKPLAEALELHTQTAVLALHQGRDGWLLETDAGVRCGPFDAVVCSAPVAQSRALLADLPDMQDALANVRMAPCWAVMLRYSCALPVAFDAHRYETGAIGWLARQSSRPGYAGRAHSWVLHASRAWSEAHLEQPAEQVAELLQGELVKLLGVRLPPVSFAAAHRWRYALTTQPLGKAFLANQDGSLYCAGDWCLGARVESAHSSGEAVAAALAKRFPLGPPRRGG